MVINIQQSIFSELANFLVSQPSLQDIANYKVSESVQQYIDDLLEKNREQGLTSAEQSDLDSILAVVQMMDIAKAKAQLMLTGKS